MDCGLQSEAVACPKSGLSRRRESRQRLGDDRSGADRAVGPVRFRTWRATWREVVAVAGTWIFVVDRSSPFLHAPGFTVGGGSYCTGIHHPPNTSRSVVVGTPPS